MSEIVTSYAYMALALAPPHGPDHACLICADVRAATGCRPLPPVFVRTVPRWWPTRPKSREHRIAIGAGHLGITSAEYLAHIAAGERHCSDCRAWHSEADMVRRKTGLDGFDRICKRASLRRRYAWQARQSRKVAS